VGASRFRTGIYTTLLCESGKHRDGSGYFYVIEQHIHRDNIHNYCNGHGSRLKNVDISAEFLMQSLHWGSFYIPLLIMSFTTSETEKMISGLVSITCLATGIILGANISNTEIFIATRTYTGALVVGLVITK
jgi:hypothetical protein